MKILHTADWHIGNFPGPEKDGKNLRADDTGNCINHLADIARLEKPDVIVISGDLFHQARVWADRGLSEVKTAIRAIDVLSETSPVLVLRGTPNHDGEEQFNLLSAHFETNEKVMIITNPNVVLVKLNNGITAQFACLPGFDRGKYRAKFPGLSKEEENVTFTQELGNSVLALKAACDPALPNILLTHYTVPGCNTESGQTPFLAQFEPVIMPEVLDAAQFDIVCLGHIHRPQVLESCKDVYYSGALNAMNFNDEGQKRGFWIHELDETRPAARLLKGHFYETPIREFKTIRLDDVAVEAYNVFGITGLASHEIQDCENKIVRVIYSCDEDQNKAFNRAAFEHDLYEYAKVFWVSEITPDNISTGTNKNELSEKNNPEANLVEYLKEKALDDAEIEAVVSLARPIIAEAMANNSLSKLTGMFVPLEIEVKNYRNYAEETFSFKDVTFCTINGKNGAGKSSLFMDAILDALYEEPREGELTAWIRADEKARSGSISFTFAIGDKTFRVVRARAKSGKATLNLSELVDGEWENRSKEKYKDTQDEIVNILGMDSLTFRSCALIMQDQYGLFLQADKEARMSILGNILGLGIYNDMESIARNRLGDCNRKISFAKNDILTHQKRISELGNPAEEIETKEQAIKFQEDSKARLAQERDRINVLLNSQLELAKKAASLLDSINTLREKEKALTGKLFEQNNIISTTYALLSEEEAILAKVAELESLLQKQNGMTAQKALFDKLTETVRVALEELNNAANVVSEEKEKIFRIDDQLIPLKAKYRQAVECETSAKEYDIKAAELSTLEQKADEYNILLNELRAIEKELAELQADFKQESAIRVSKLQEYERKTQILSSCNCLDIEKANCQFLADAKEAAVIIETYRAEYTSWKIAAQAKIDELEKKRQSILEKMYDTGYDTAKVSELRDRIRAIEPYKKLYDTAQTLLAQIEQIELRKADAEKVLADAHERVRDAESKHTKALAELENSGNFKEEYQKLSDEISALSCWKEKADMLPVQKERKKTAQTRIAEIDEEMNSVLADIAKLTEEREKILEDTCDLDTLKRKLAELDNHLSLTQKNIDVIRTDIGTLTKMADDIKATEAQIKELQSRINADAEIAARYEVLKNAFSQDGVPHNIIRTIIPILTATSNTILGQMTGGKMGMQFVTDKVLKSNKKEVVTLDIVIEEYGKDTLPYLSKSGGEKVKSSLSAILSLAEIKSTQAGIQLGMLFIDEPPFLDDDGTQAYCDALETIQSRYKDLKIMAITHDPTFKARFPQNLDVIKTENGSKVIFE